MSKADKYVVHRAKRLSAVLTHGREVLVEIDLPDAGLLPGVRMAICMEPREAREVAALLFRMADEAESESN
jgi:hypothetical protein